MKRLSLAIVTLLACAGAQAASEKVEMNLVTAQGVGQSIGTVVIDETEGGLKFTPHLKALPPGEHGFHIHAKGSCQPAIKDGKAVAAEAAGGHLDPQNTGKHEGPEGQGHLGDLPVLVVNNDGIATEPVTAPRLKSLEVRVERLVTQPDTGAFTSVWLSCHCACFNVASATSTLACIALTFRLALSRSSAEM